MESNHNFFENPRYNVKVLDAIRKITSILKVTLGPFGSNVFTEDQMLQHTVTKDGYTVVSKLAFEEPLEKCILNYIQKVSARLNRTTGDGTTSAIIIAGYLINELMKLQEKDYRSYNDRELTKTVKRISLELIDRVSQRAIKLPKFENCDGDYSDNIVLQNVYKLLRSVALVSSNHNEEIASLIAKTWVKLGHLAAMNVKSAHGDTNTFVQFSSGMEIENGMILPIFMTNTESRDFNVAGDTRVFMSLVPLDATYVHAFSVMLNEICMIRKQALLIMAPSYDDAFMAFLMQNKQKFKEALPVVAINVATKSGTALDRFEDIAYYTDTAPFGSNLCPETNMKDFVEKANLYLGKLDEVKVTEKRTTIINNSINKETINARVAELTEMLNTLHQEECETKDISEEISRINNRIRSLTGNCMATIFVGGETEQEKKTNMYLVEDAICATKSAMKHGILPGCCLETMSVVSDMINEYTEQLKSLTVVAGEVATARTADLLGNSKFIATAIRTAYLKFYQDVLRLQEIRDAETYLVVNYRTNNKIPVVVGQYISSDDYLLKTIDLEKEAYDGNAYLFTSAESDIEIIKNAFSIALLIVTSKAFVSSSNFFDNETGKIHRR